MNQFDQRLKDVPKAQPSLYLMIYFKDNQKVYRAGGATCMTPGLSRL
jgi:hypothetical protein